MEDASSGLVVLLLMFAGGAVVSFFFFSGWRERRRWEQVYAREVAELRALDDDALAARVRALIPSLWPHDPPARVVERMRPLTGWTPRALRDAISLLCDEANEEDRRGTFNVMEAGVGTILAVVMERVRQARRDEARRG